MFAVSSTVDWSEKRECMQMLGITNVVRWIDGECEGFCGWKREEAQF